MKGNGRVIGVVRMWVTNQRGYVKAEEEYSGLVTVEDAFVLDTIRKASTWCILVGIEDRICYRGNSAAGRVQVLDQGYPEVGEESGKRRLIYQATFEADTLNARGVNTAVLVHRTEEPAQGVAYARINPVMRIGIGDILRIQWECQALK
jgi:hypothetical protein